MLTDREFNGGGRFAYCGPPEAPHFFHACDAERLSGGGSEGGKVMRDAVKHSESNRTKCWLL